MQQPENMAEMLDSIAALAREGTAIKVIPTIATREMGALGTAQRTLTNEYLANMQALTMGVAAAKPGTMVPVVQTDQYYAQTDHEQTFSRLSALVEAVARENR